MRLCRVATCSLDQWALDFDGNLLRIQESIKEAKRRGCVYRVGPELEITGYGCEDHFLEIDTCTHAWESLAEILSGDLTHDILCDIGLPVEFSNVRYNCRALCLNGRILLLRPKFDLANDGNYRETRWFRAWKKRGHVEEFCLPREFRERMARRRRERTGGKGGAWEAQRVAPFGDACLQLEDTALGAESCEELFAPSSPHISHALSGVEIIGNGSASHHELRKIRTRASLLLSASAKGGGLYLYANQRGCDGSRLYYDGCASICINGSFVAFGSQFDLGREVEVVDAVVDLDEVSSYRASISSLQEQASLSHSLSSSSSLTPPFRINVSFRMCNVRERPREGLGRATGDGEIEREGEEEERERDGEVNLSPFVDDFLRSASLSPSPPSTPSFPLPEEEIAFGPSSWLYDYLRRSGAGGFLLPLSGGADSSSVAAIVCCMCQRLAKEISQGNEEVKRDVLRILREDERSLERTGEGMLLLTDPKKLANRMLHTVYMGTRNSSQETRERARHLAEQIGSFHVEADVDSLVLSPLLLFRSVTGLSPQFRASGGNALENIALQNLQARERMVFAFLLAQLLPWARGVGREALREKERETGEKQGEREGEEEERARVASLLFKGPLIGSLSERRNGEKGGGNPSAQGLPFSPLPFTSNPGISPLPPPPSSSSSSSSSSLSPLPFYPFGFLLVLGSSNVDESLRGYLTKYDCSSADLNPIGSVSKRDIRIFLRWASRSLNLTILEDVERAKPTAELEPITQEYTQLDEEDMGMTYDELSVFGRLRKTHKCGPLSLFQNVSQQILKEHQALLSSFSSSLPSSSSPTLYSSFMTSICKRGVHESPPQTPASSPARSLSAPPSTCLAASSLPSLLSALDSACAQVKKFFVFYSINRHKLTTLTPSYHAENYSPEDNRFDLRPFLYESSFKRQFKRVEESLAQAKEKLRRGWEKERGEESDTIGEREGAAEHYGTEA